ncbi:2Fe-2S iron-sulfur cluster-binding protein [Nocardioides sp. CPCC 206347]|uniref:2Fe-2S iron-sulfur cluster-binding protein n=1 Tax=unclassified Nocardioides TaxID=2615069 RepID=UPI0036133DAE
MSDQTTVVFSQNGHQTPVQVPVGTTMMRAAIDNLISGVVGECGGDLSCATCHVFVEESWSSRLEPACEDERAMLDATAEEPTEHSRLSCQLTCTADTDGIVLHIPESQ